MTMMMKAKKTTMVMTAKKVRTEKKECALEERFFYMVFLNV